mmetsp:Transcript_25112/g.76225  ORF Transcript_25112/g.76225 Transcript_25112/m.76225 type:complete len:269 (-) Transcript_25112:445-1251(-)
MARRRTVLSLEGNIGAGKSTLMRLLRDCAGLAVVDEPVARWQSVRAPGEAEVEPPVNLLDLFYKDQKRWAFTFQTFAFLSRAQAAVDALRFQEDSGQPSSAAVVLERSLDSDKHVFATNCFETGLFTRAEWAVYSNYHQWTAQQHPFVSVDGFIYLRTELRTCQQRCAKRSRPEDESIGLDYLGQIHTRHEDWLLPSAQPHTSGLARNLDLLRTTTKHGVPVLVVDCNKEFENDKERNMEIMKAVCHFAEEVTNQWRTRDAVTSAQTS